MQYIADRKNIVFGVHLAANCFNLGSPKSRFVSRDFNGQFLDLPPTLDRGHLNSVIPPL
jgi:hypothetical protein